MFRAVIGLAILAACQGDAPPPSSTAAAESLAPEPGVLRLMGTGAMTPLAQELAAGFHGVRVVVEPSVGSGGGVRAAADGAVDLGMISRALSDEERALGLKVRTVARDTVVIAAHRGVPRLTREQLLDLYAGRARSFPDGSPAIVLLRDANESANGALERVLPELKPLREAAYRRGGFRVLYHDDAMGEALAATPGAFGVFSQGAITVGKLPLASVEGVPTATRDLSFVYRDDRYVEEFLAFVASDEGRRIIRASGYQELP